ncbi:hypothetical protein HY733_03670 [Candidatus Uhrbacteria bacterium]|nr:hypothetical protein [Candidatus Uhrbacteria bacterium]
MVKDILPADAEVSKKRESVSPPEEQTPEVPVAPDLAVEQPTMETDMETMQGGVSPAELPQTQELVTTRVSQATTTKPVDRLDEEIEDILEEDLKKMYLSLPPEKQEKFRKEGELTRSRIRVLVGSAKVNAKKIFHLIRRWLKLIPGVNRFFLEQEAKIKTDKILLVGEEEKKRSERL